MKIIEKIKGYKKEIVATLIGLGIGAAVVIVVGALTGKEEVLQLESVDYEVLPVLEVVESENEEE